MNILSEEDYTVLPLRFIFYFLFINAFYTAT